MAKDRRAGKVFIDWSQNNLAWARITTLMHDRLRLAGIELP
jgi:DNA primase